MLEAAAEKAALTGQVRAFLAWVGPERKLTATGRIGLADARHLVELLGTGDTIDPDIGGRVFKTRSSEDLAHLSRIATRAKAARLVRVTGTRLVPVKKNTALADRPLDLVLALLEAYPRLGQPLFPRNTWRQSLVGDEFTDISQELLTALLRSAGPCPLGELGDIAYDAIETRYVLACPLRSSTTRCGARSPPTSRSRWPPCACSASWSSTARPTRPGSPTWAGTRSAASAAWPSQATRCSRCGSRWPTYRIGDLLKTGGRAGYEYDFGDGWDHELAVEASVVADAVTVYPACTGGGGACPPEDCGGPGGFADLKELLAGPPSPEHEEMRAWADEDYDPARFDLAAANAAAVSA